LFCLLEIRKALPIAHTEMPWPVEEVLALELVLPLVRELVLPLALELVLPLALELVLPLALELVLPLVECRPQLLSFCEMRDQ
jgi:hypothetical protein